MTARATGQAERLDRSRGKELEDTEDTQSRDTADASALLAPNRTHALLHAPGTEDKRAPEVPRSVAVEATSGTSFERGSDDEGMLLNEFASHQGEPQASRRRAASTKRSADEELGMASLRGTPRAIRVT